MRAILIDDEELALKYLEHHLRRLGDFEIIGKYTDPLQGKLKVEETDVDVVFLDIHIPELNGIELAEMLLERKPHLQVVFVTAYDKYAIKAFELNALDYVLKPIHMDRLRLTVRRLYAHRRNEIAASTTPESTSWRILMLDAFRIYEGTQEYHVPLQWRTAKAQEIFFYLLHHRGKVVSKATLIELLWADFDLNKAYPQLYTAVYHIRRILEPFGRDRILLQNTADGYLLRLDGVYLDVDEFDSFIKAGLELSEDTVSEYERILKLFKSEYLEEYDYVWAELERQRFQLQWIRMKLNLVHWYMESEDFEQAFKHIEQVCTRYPLEEQAQLLYLKICDRMGFHFLVQRQYTLLETVMEAELSEKPNPEIVKWYKGWDKKRQKG
ncbi:response regulator [Paenibacillus tritici]|uniref:Response regulator n=1 Tax=Paenibacillus tritici TaxID=1873425 RepID=A0ABX2DRV7_9BACL|nr:response regulator [Paenibacillus tritici]NQX46907.1 response regulator [Paenibacillus tritici]